MPRTAPQPDWLVGGDRRSVATERIHAAAAKLIARHGLDGFSIDMLAEQIHCSRATVYRYAGGKTEIRDAVLTHAAEQILDSVLTGVRNLAGAQRVVTAIMLALKFLRSDPLGRQLIGSITGPASGGWVTGSTIVQGFANRVIGLAESDPPAAQWLIRIFMSMLYWPAEDVEAEHQLLQRFFAPAFGGPHPTEAGSGVAQR